MPISIIIPTFNRAEVIIKTLDSIIEQTYQDWVCFVVDDHSSDNTKDVVNHFIKKDSRVQYLVNEHKKGAQGARNTGLYHCNTEWVFFFDSDNQMHSDCLRVLSDAINEHVDVVQCFSDVLSVESREIVRTFDWRNYGNIHDKLLCALTYVDFNHSIIRRSKLLEIGGLDEDCPCMQEWDTHIRLSRTSVYTTVEKVLVDYFVGGTDAISSNPRRDIIGKTYVLKKNIREWKSYPTRLKHFVFYLSTLISNINDKQFQKDAFHELSLIVPNWYVLRGKVLSSLLHFRDVMLKVLK